MIRPTCLLIALTLLPAPVIAEENPIFDHLINVGVRLDEETIIQLPPPSLKNGLDQAQEKKILDSVRGQRPFSEFIRNSRVAPFNLKLSSKKNKNGERTGQTLDLWFVCYGKLATIDENKLIEELGGLEKPRANEAAGEHKLTPDELKAREIEPNEMLDERYSYFSGPLLSRVRVSGVTRSAITRSDDETLIASVLDERFSGDEQFPNQWRSQQKDNQGRIVLGAAQKYEGYGGYGKATQLRHPEGAILVEFHVAFNEPYGWFKGANLLRSKLPLIIQNKVRDFRTKLANLSK